MNGPETSILKVNSSNISSIAFDPETDTLTVEFTNGDSYDYMNVPPQVYRAFGAAGSAGAYFYRHIRGRYAFDGPK
jgi:hypothetical protein